MRDRYLIAIVDDEPSVCRALNRLVRSARMDAETFNSAGEFMDTGVSHEPDCLILDVQMPGMTGLELCGQLAGRKSRIPVIFITAHDAPAARETADERGAVAYLTKPVDDQLLLDAIGKALVGKGSAEKRTGR
jgi:FixJ family two-component response regulator